MHIHAHAKINWTLAVTGMRPDGYHRLDTLMQTIALHDTLTLEAAQDLRLTIEGANTLSTGEDNLVLRAAHALRRHAGVSSGAHMHLIKRIPSGAGLGGGSADAAATLRALDRLWDLSCTPQTLAEIALSLGADVPFCLRGGLARAQGIGEALTPLAAPAPIDLVVLHPGISLSTPAVFRAFDACAPVSVPPVGSAAQAIQRRDLTALAASLGNALQPAAISLCPQVATCVAALQRVGALHAQMTGSGSAVFGVFDSPEAAKRAAEATGGIATQTLC